MRDKVCEGVNFIVTDRNGFDAPELGMELASALHKLYPADFKIERITELLVNQSVYDALVAGQDPRTDRAGVAGGAGQVYPDQEEIFDLLATWLPFGGHGALC